MPASSRTVAVAVAVLLSACSVAGPRIEPRITILPVDTHSLATPNDTRLRHLDLDLRVSFGSQRIDGRGSLHFDRLTEGAPLVLDTGPGLTVSAARGPDGTPRAFHLGAEDPVRGRALTIDLERADRRIDLEWQVDAGARAVQWLDPEQTASRMAPFLFTQGQAILTRTWIPLQDSPGVRVTWTAIVRTPDQPELSTLMSADLRESPEPGVTRFSMTHPVPSYLIALAIGRLSSRAVSERCAIWAEPTVIDGAARELEDVERMVQTVESLYGPYRFGRYDVLILPPSFPFGGMENPCMTFATPTILAGDKSLVALVAHELAHSWSGNLVTNATWRDFWLNEGFTVYVEQRIVESLFGAERAAAETRNGLTQLDAELRELPAADTVLHIDLHGRDPDDGMTAVAYDKGAAFLRRIEELCGRERFDPFLRAWFSEHAFQSLTTADFLAFLRERLLAALPLAAAALDIDAWVHGTGLPPDCPRPRSILLDAVDAASARFVAGGAAGELGARGWSTTQWLHFLGNLPAETSRAMLGELDIVYRLTDTGNAEILAAWLEINLRVGYDDLPAALDSRLAKFLFQVGRRKFVKPLFQSLAGTDKGKLRARAIYTVVRPRYHAVTRRTIDQMLGWPFQD